MNATTVPPLAAYCDRLSVRPGEHIALKASSLNEGSISARVVQIGYADPNPEGPGVRMIPVNAIAPQKFPARFQPTQIGSWGKLPCTGLFCDPVLHISLRVQPWLVRENGAALLTLAQADGRIVWTLRLTTDGLTLGCATSPAVAISITPKRRKWYEVSACFDLRKGLVTLKAVSLDGQQQACESGAITWSAPKNATLFLAAAPESGTMKDHFNGRLEDIVFRSESAEGPIRAFWDFSVSMQGVAVIDRGPLGLNGQLVNLPTRAVRGSLWDGTEQSFLHAPRQYAAIHFHEDDIYDAGWETDLEIEIPVGMPSGVYGIVLEQGSVSDTVPFYVIAPKGKPGAKICYLAATYTYLAYGNHARGNLDEAMKTRMADRVYNMSVYELIGQYCY